MPKLEGEMDIPHRQFASKPMTAEMFTEENLIRDLDDDLKKLLGDLVIFWGKTDFRTRYFALTFLDDSGSQAKNPFWDRYSILKRIIKQAREKEIVVAVNLFGFMGSSRRVITHTRNLLTHGDIMGVLKSPPDHLRITTFPPGGGWSQDVIPIDQLRWVVEFLKQTTVFQDRMIKGFEDHHDYKSGVLPPT